jgi:cell division transport system permease protein
MSFSYAVKEGFSGFKRAKLSTLISMITITISLLLLGIFAVVTIHTSRFIDALRNKVEMEAFLQEPLSPQELASLKKRVDAIDGVEKIVYVSKEEAAKIFEEEFGENISSVLDFNPLPASFKIFLKEGYKTSSKAQGINKQLLSLKGIESVKYRKELLELIDTRTVTVHNLTLGLGLLISLSAIFLVSNTIRLAIYAKRQLLHTMELVGATPAFIRYPFLLEGIMQGFLGGIIATCILFLLLEYATPLLSGQLSEFIHMEALFYLIVIVAGIFLGLVGSLISVARFIGIAARS